MNAKDRSSGIRTAAVIAVAAATSLFATAYLTAGPIPAIGPDSTLLTVYMRLNLFFSTFTLVLLCSLLVTYSRIYVDIPNTFTLGLLLFTMSLMMFALTSNPLLPLLFETRPVGASEFTILPNVFASVAVVILRYHSYT